MVLDVMKMLDSKTRSWWVAGLTGAALVLSGWMAGGTALAQPADPTFELGKKDDVKDVKDVEWTAKGEAGLVSTTGNSKTTTVSTGLNAIRKDKDNKLEASLVGTFARATIRTVADANGNGVIDPDELHSNSTNSAEDAAFKLRYDRYLTELDALYVTGLIATDRPAGKNLIGGGQAGYSRGLYKTDAQEVLAEIGYDLSYLRLADDTSTTIHSVRVFAGYKAKLNKIASLDAAVEALFNANRITIGTENAGVFKDSRINGNIALTASLSSKLTLAASFAQRC